MHKPIAREVKMPAPRWRRSGQKKRPGFGALFMN
jgi:hypothetical protein